MAQKFDAIDLRHPHVGDDTLRFDSRMASRKVLAESWARAANWALPSKKTRDYRAASSSSMTCTTGSLGIVECLRIDDTQRESEDRSAAGVWRDGDLPTVRFNNGTGNRETNTQAASFRRGEGLE
jgi:hypothetical protein